MNLGSMNNTRISFDISRRQGTGIDDLNIVIGSRIDTDFVCKTTIYGIVSEDIDALCDRLQSLKTQL